MKYLLAILAAFALVFSAPLAAQEKKQLPKGTKKTAKKPVVKKQSSVPNNDWSRFNSGAKKDLDDLEKKKKAGK